MLIRCMLVGNKVPGMSYVGLADVRKIFFSIRDS